MEEFVQSSGEHGVIVFTLGSMVHNLSDEKSNVIAKALSQLPQKVNFFLSLKQVALFFSLPLLSVSLLCLERPVLHLHPCWT